MKLKPYYQRAERFKEGKGDFKRIKEAQKASGLLARLIRPYIELLEKLNEDLFLIKESAVKFTFFSTDMNFSSKQLTEQSSEQALFMKEVLQKIDTFESELNGMTSLMDDLVQHAQLSHHTFQSFVEQNDTLIDEMKALDDKTLASSQSLSIGKESIEKNAKYSEEITKSMVDISNSVQSVLSETTHVAKTLSSIDEIAENIHTLAINAAVEAARAGSSGKGFGVIAKEMHGLAGTAQNAISDVSQTIEQLSESNKRVQNTIVNWESTAKELKEWSARSNDSYVELISYVDEIHEVAAQVNKELYTQIGKMQDLIRYGEKTHHSSIEAGTKLKNQISGYAEIQAGITEASKNAQHQADVSVMLAELSQFLKVGGEELAIFIRTFELDEESLKFRNGRRAVRHRLMYNLEIVDEDMSHVGFIGDLSPGGMMILSDKMEEEGSVKKFKLVLPRLFRKEESHIVVKGKVRWVKKEGSGFLPVSYGVQFEPMSEQVKRSIDELMESLAISKHALFEEDGMLEEL